MRCDLVSVDCGENGAGSGNGRLSVTDTLVGLVFIVKTDWNLLIYSRERVVTGQFMRLFPAALRDQLFLRDIKC